MIVRYGDSWGRVDLEVGVHVSSALRMMVTTTSTTRPPGVTALWHLELHQPHFINMLHDARVEHESTTC